MEQRTMLTGKRVLATPCFTQLTSRARMMCLRQAYTSLQTPLACKTKGYQGGLRDDMAEEVALQLVAQICSVPPRPVYTERGGQRSPQRLHERLPFFRRHYPLRPTSALLRVMSTQRTLLKHCKLATFI